MSSIEWLAAGDDAQVLGVKGNDPRGLHEHAYARGPGHAPIWENYVIAQTVAASRGQIPAHALAFGVEVNGPHLHLRF